MRANLIPAELAAPDTMEARFARGVPYARRKRLGQFFTPPAIAHAMVRWVCAHRPRSLLDPAVGPGIFLEALTQAGRAIPRVDAMDIDAGALEHARARSRTAGVNARLRQGDFLGASFDPKYDAIVCNPPYVRHHDATIDAGVYDALETRFGVRLSRTTNLYAMFILKIIAHLSSRGRAAIITPTEFLNADFGRAIKQILLATPAFRGFIVFDYTRSIFDGLMTTATITLLDSARSDGDVVRCAHLRDPDRLKAALASFDTDGSCEGVEWLSARRSRLSPADKWSTSAFQIAESTTPAGGLVPLGEYADCCRGIATGANAFFTLSAAQARAHRLPQAVLRPCITKAAHAGGMVFGEDDLQGLIDGGKRCLLVDAQAAEGNAAVRRYLQLGRAQSIHERYLTRHRRPWYAIERRTPADFWVTVFGRSRLRFVHNAAGTLNLTAFHGIHVKAACRRFVPTLMAYFQSSACRHACALQHRVYGDGLLKFEPKDVERLRVPDFRTFSSTRLRSATVLGKKLIAGQWTPARQRRVDNAFEL